MALSKKEQDELLRLTDSEEEYFRYNKSAIFFGDDDYYAPSGQIVHNRHKYPKFIEFFKAGSIYRQRSLIAVNRVGKSMAAMYEVYCHATGKYPSWWEGHRFNTPPIIYICGDRGETVRDSLQSILLGEQGEKYTGLLSEKDVEKLVPMPGIPSCIGQYVIKHTKGTSSIKVKTYQSGREAFEGFKAHVVVLDEESPRDILSECLTRTMTTKGIVIATFTPDRGLSDTYLYFTDPKNSAFVKTFNVTWDDVPHLSKEQKAELYNSYHPHERDCRSKGVPYLGSGKIYPISEERFIIDPIKIPRHWPRMYGMDVGYAHPTAVLWGALDREDDVLYIYSEHKAAEVQPSTHAAAILARGSWIPGVIDTGSASGSPIDGRRLIDIYNKFGLNLTFVKKGSGSVEAGILEVYDRLESGRLKIFNSCVQTIDEIRLYRRKDNSQIVKEKDDLMDALRYLVRSLQLADVESAEEYEASGSYYGGSRNSVTGY